MPMVEKHCHACGSKNILRDAYLSWDHETQEWIIWGMKDTFYCTECESTQGPNEVVTGPGNKTNDRRD